MNKINELKALYGELRSFYKVVDTTKDRAYIWDSDFIKIFDEFLKGKELFSYTKSDKNRIDKFISFSKNLISEDDEDYLIMKEFNKYLGSLK